MPGEVYCLSPRNMSFCIVLSICIDWDFHLLSSYKCFQWYTRLPISRQHLLKNRPWNCFKILRKFYQLPVRRIKVWRRHLKIYSQTIFSSKKLHYKCLFYFKFSFERYFSLIFLFLYIDFDFLFLTLRSMLNSIIHNAFILLI